MPGDRTLILVVEDDALIRMNGCDILEDAGFSVVDAGSADEAVAMLEQHDDVRLLFSDIEMPGSMNGLELAKLVHDRWPGIGLLITSGNHRPDERDLPDDGRFVPKPWQRTDLLDKVRSILKAGRADTPPA
ncbi:response regulator [Nostoc sp. 3335mG]|nr:response regulator [Nostoc sp. 3335mG]